MSERCTGCGSTKTIAQIRAEKPNALSCCPERKMVADPNQIASIKVGDAIFPISAFAPHAQQALRNHGQTLERLAARGGICWLEARAILTDTYWADVPNSPDNEKIVRAIIERDSK